MQNLSWVFKFFFICFFLGLRTSAAQTCSETDRAALLSFKSRIITDTTGVLSSWAGRDCCGGDWEGIDCDQKTGRVTGLQLQAPSNKDSALFMKGTLSPSLGEIRFLQVLVIGGMKQIGGSIPESLSTLRHLTQLVLEDNGLEGPIPPSLGQLPLLKTLSLSSNHLKGSIPSSLGNLHNLAQLNLARNLLTGPIPPTLTTLHGLLYLDLSSNFLNGFIPNFIGKFQNLTFLDLSYNQFKGQITPSLCSLPNLLDMSLGHNQLTGRIPGVIGNLKSLTTFSVSGNNLSGQIPESISRLQNLWYLNLSRNGFSDPLPSTLAKGIPSLLSLDLSYNNFHLQKVPDWVRSRALTDLHLAGCNLKGLLPTFLRPNSFNSIDLSNNLLTGGVTNFFAKMDNIQNIKLSNNLLHSDISNIILPSGVASIDLHSNQLFGSFSKLLQNSHTTFLEVLDISHNQITGSIPEFSSGSVMKSFNVSSNKITGQIPSSISYLIELEKIDISRNMIKGSIPPTLGELTQLEWFDLSINALTGRIPNSLLGLKRLRHANFRSNRLCGEIPQGRPFNIFPVAAYVHNLCLCGKPMTPCKGRRHIGLEPLIS